MDRLQFKKNGVAYTPTVAVGEDLRLQFDLSNITISQNPVDFTEPGGSVTVTLKSGGMILFEKALTSADTTQWSFVMTPTETANAFRDLEKPQAISLILQTTHTVLDINRFRFGTIEVHEAIA